MARDAELESFQNTVWEHFRLHGRHDLPWRIPEADGSFDPYKILVSEIMLQQTQVPRVIPKYYEFLEKFPTVDVLASARLATVLKTWNGLGYNRRAKFLWQAAQAIVQEHDAIFPSEEIVLVRLPGVGKNTAHAIRAYAFNQPAIFIETNIRTVYIFHFFQNREGVSDAEILEIIEKTADQNDPRSWHWALMDYGSFLKQTIGNLNKLSKSYARQSPFEGSKRQIRGKILRLLGEKPMTKQALAAKINDDRLDAVLADLLAESLIRKQSDRYAL
jgi:A/G-specific adenine glycosylase